MIREVGQTKGGHSKQDKRLLAHTLAIQQWGKRAKGTSLQYYRGESGEIEQQIDSYSFIPHVQRKSQDFKLDQQEKRETIYNDSQQEERQVQSFC